MLSEDYDTTGRILKVRGLPDAIARLRRTLAASRAAPPWGTHTAPKCAAH